MLTDTRQALLNAIRAQPDDDAPRLIYADWLDENGDPARAAFIRLQCEEARLPVWDPARKVWRREWRRLLREHAWRWRDGLPRWARGEYERGFLRDVHMNGTQFRRAMAEIWAIEPIANISLYGAVPDFIAAVQDPLFAQVRGLVVWGLAGYEGDALHALAETPHALHLQRLDLGLMPSDAYRPETLTALRQWRLPDLRELQCHYAPPASAKNIEQVQLALLGGKLLATVSEAMFLGNRTQAVAEAFANAPTRHLRKLWLANHDDDCWLDILTHTKRLPALHSLTVAGCDASARALHAFFNSPLLGRLTELAFFNGQWSNRTVADLMRSHIQQLHELQLHGNMRLTDGCVKALCAASADLANLRYLNIVWTNITTEGHQQLRTALPQCHIAY
jgi:uncharacterized protein (TIGR02996 family)